MPQIDDEAALIAAICADPDNAACWSVYADSLQGRGNPTGELIALQLERERCAGDRLAEIDARIEGLTRGRDSSDLGMRSRLSVDQVDESLADRVRPMLLHSLNVFARDLDDKRLATLLSALAYMPLRELFLSPNELSVLRQVLAACPRLTYLGLSEISNAQAEVIAQTTPRLVELVVINRSPLDDTGLTTLANISTLRRLDLPGGRVTAAGIAALLDRVPLEQLVIASNPIGHAGIARICALPALRELAIEDTGFTSDTIELIARSPTLVTLRRLRLASHRGDSHLTPHDLKTLMASPYLSRDLVFQIDGHALGLVSEWVESSAPEYTGMFWVTKPTGPITERFRVEVSGQP